MSEPARSAEYVAACPRCGVTAQVRFLRYDTQEVADRCGRCGVEMRLLNDGTDHG